jgi:hypothetical protein
MSDIQLRGYSERGMINAICYEIRYSHNGFKLLRDLLRLCTFPSAKPDFTQFHSATMIIEQSFAGFGDLDLLCLLEGHCTQAICIEAKVKTFDVKHRSIRGEWNRFKSTRRTKSYRSNLFAQLYGKMRLLKQVSNMDEEMAADALAEKWSLGKNQVVRNAAHALSQYCSEGWMIALVPESKANAHAFFETELSAPPPGLPDWQYTHFGYLTWQELFAHCSTHADEWPETLANFKYNEGQIFGIPTVVWESPTGPQQVTIKRRGPQNTRIVLEDGTDRKVPNTTLRESDSR